MAFLDLCGYLSMIFFGWKLLNRFYKLLWPYVIGPKLGFTQDPAKLGKWAVVTGSTDGIGKEYARHFASKGMSLFLISRNPAKLDAVKLELESQHPTAVVRNYTVDFANADFNTYRKLEEELDRLEIGILVNNVSMAPEYPGKFIETATKEIYDSVMVNCMSCIMMTRIVLSQMIARNKGAIVNLASSSALRPAPLLNYYSASKVFVDFFTRALAAEHAGSGLIFQTQRPWSVRTNMTHFREYKDSLPNAAEYVAEVTKTLGLTSSTGGTKRFQFYENALNFGILPDFLWYSLARHNLQTSRDAYLEQAKQC